MTHSEHFISSYVNIHTHLLLPRILLPSLKPEEPDFKRVLHFKQNATLFLLYTS